MSSTTHIEYRQVQAPRENGAALIEPPLDAVAGMVENNLRIGHQDGRDLQGRSLRELSAAARRDLIEQAQRWTSAYRDVPPLPAAGAERVFLAGHQPQLFHPGVWFKNFALDHLARRFDAVAVNLQIDSDTIKSTALRVPGGPADDPHVVSIPMDQAGKPIPYEERKILNCRLFADFGRRVSDALGSLVRGPIVEQLWPLAVRRSYESENLGTCLAQARHQLEGQWGLRTLEVPQSRICQSESFLWLVAHLLAQLPRFSEVYNTAVHDYRRVHGIRNAAHPVPDLGSDGPWREAPLWVWTAHDPTRRALFARQRGAEVLVTDRHQLEFALPLTPEGDAGRAVEKLLELAQGGVKIRSRALVTTLWARLALGDLFLHGIGGAKYDQVTDALVERFFQRTPPGYMVLSATLLLPAPRPAASTDEPRQIARQLRELDWHAERWLDGKPEATNRHVQDLLAAKNRWIRTPQTPTNAWQRYREFRRINEALQPWVADLRQRLIERRAQVRQSQRADRVLSSREYGFCLYPENNLRNFFASLLPKTAATRFDHA